MTRARIVLGLDPGSRRTGFGLLASGPDGIERIASGEVRLDTERAFAERLPELREKLLRLLREHRPHEAAMETCFVARSVRAALVLGHVRGVLLLLCLESGLDVFEYAPAEIKRAVTGNGSASKTQVARMLPRLMIGPPASPTEDEADALAAAYCHLVRPAIARAKPLRGIP
ncbi:MAG: crossover junction endodeoxyribonuclease RuvC [Candidatus Eisenbacteria bacterium]|nr:crossover junction endodeoxyribonuclease RuvC [Candidatus Eisenbacteria bacterium]